MQRYRHVNHLLSRYAHGQLRSSQRARVQNHIRRCPSCREALARESLIAADLRRELPQIGQAQAKQLAGVWIGVWQEVNRPRYRAGLPVPGLSVILGMLLVLAVALPLLAGGGIRAIAAPNQALPISTASPTPGTAGTDEARLIDSAGAQPVQGVLPDASATVAYAIPVGASPAPQPQATISPEASYLGAGQ
ncbi:MAG: zf-HC2 domain-containing protein [Chloroflexi bacterium]|nr:zf-HC2 domain-containing protein [Chloroflexota bacterium]